MRYFEYSPTVEQKLVILQTFKQSAEKGLSRFQCYKDAADVAQIQNPDFCPEISRAIGVDIILVARGLYQGNSVISTRRGKNARGRQN